MGEWELKALKGKIEAKYLRNRQMAEKVGIVDWVNGPVVKAAKVHSVEMMELVEIGDERLIGEIIELHEDRATIQVYENTTGLKPGSVMWGTGIPLSVELGPGLIGNIYDGIQRPLNTDFHRR